MGELSVSSITVEELLSKLRSREWQIPQFQRDFVWTVGDVVELVLSIIGSRPIGMATVWEQADGEGLELGPISLPDRDEATKAEIKREYSAKANDPNKVYAVLDGLQRCTAIAMVFGGFHTTHRDYRTSGRYYLNVESLDPVGQVRYYRESEIKAKGLSNDAKCIATGLFPLASNLPQEPFMTQWLRYIQAIRDPSFYPQGKLPSPPELDRRDTILKKAFEGISKTKLAVYSVPDSYSLSDICDIFEKLNTTGTKVSTVDLIHSWLYSETANDSEGPVLIRGWIDDLGQKDGMIGWSSSTDRPELIMQMITACHVAMEAKAAPRKVGKSPLTIIASVKAGDLLSTPTAHWKLMISNDSHLAAFTKDFQGVVAGGLFPWTLCPYPVTFAVYVALRAHAYFDDANTHKWSIEDLNAVFRAFFWRNALTNRYDQGFLTQLGEDIRQLKAILSMRKDFGSANKWLDKADTELSGLFKKSIPDHSELVEYLTDGRPGGAMQKALTLPMLAASEKDLLDSSIILRFPESGAVPQMHHIYPKEWCSNNRVGPLGEVLDPKKADRDWVNGICNLMPLSRQSNNVWKVKNPGQVIAQKSLKYTQLSSLLTRLFIDEKCFDLLAIGAAGIPKFWERRAELIARDLELRMALHV